MNKKPTFGDLFEKYRDAQNIDVSFQRLASETGLSHQAIRDWQKGEPEPSQRNRDKVLTLADYLKITEPERHEWLKAAKNLKTFPETILTEFIKDLFTKSWEKPVKLLFAQANWEEPPYRYREALLEQAKTRYGSDNVLPIQVPENSSADVADCFAEFGRQCGFQGVSDSKSFARAIDQKRESLKKAKQFLLVCGFEPVSELPREELRKELVWLIRAISQNGFHVILYGGETLADIKYKTGDLSQLNVASVDWPELSGSEVEALRDYCFRDVPLDDTTVNELLKVSGEYPQLLYDCLELKQKQPDLLLKGYPKKLSKRDYIWEIFTQLKHNLDTSKQQKLLKWLQQEDLGEAQPYINDPLLRQLYWKNLLVKRNIDGEQHLCWRCQAVQMAGREIFHIKSDDAGVKQQDWGNAPDVSVFFGRTQELTVLEQWVINDRCQLVAILGLGGSGKTWLSVKLGRSGIGKTDLLLKLAQGIQTEFEYVIWRKLLNAPPVTEILGDMIQLLSNQQEINLPKTIEGKISRLLHYLNAHRCLLILDNFESVLKGGEPAGQYQKGSEGYGELLKQVGEGSHKSCLLLTSREKPPEIAFLEGDKKIVRSFEVSGLNVSEGQQIFAEISDTFSGSENDWQRLIDFYNGNPLALEFAAKHIKKVFSSNISRFLAEGKPVFGQFRDLLDWHFERLSPDEKEIIYWLAINREPVSLSELKEDILFAKEQVPETLDSLRDQFPLEESAKGFTLQPVLIEYMTERLIARAVTEIDTGKISLFNSHALMKATAKDEVRNAQIRLILNAVWERLIVKMGQKGVEKLLDKILSTLRKESPRLPGYTGGNVLNLLCQRCTANGYDFSQLAIWQAYLQDVNLHNVNFTFCDFDKLVFTQIFGNISCVAFSPDGTLLATGDVKKQINLWKVEPNQRTMTHIMTLKGHANWIWSLAFSSDSQFIVSGSMDKTAKLWEISRGECIKTLRHDASVWSVGFSPDGQTLASSDDEGMVKLWDINEGKCLNSLQGHSLCVWSIAFSPDGQFLASGSSDKTVKIWNRRGECLQTLREHTNFVRSVAFSPDSQTLVSGCDDTILRIWNIHNGQCLQTLQGHISIIRSIAYSRNGETIASSSDDETVRIWNNEGKCLKTLKHSSMVASVAFSPDSQNLASGTEAQTVQIWDSDDGESLHTWQGYSSIVWSVAYSPDGKTLASGHDDHTVRVWDDEGKCIKTWREHSHRVLSVAFSPNGQMLASGSSDKTVRLWDVRKKQALKTLPAGDNNWICSVVFSPDHQNIAGAGTDYTVKIWDVQSGQLLKTLPGHTGFVWSIVFSPNGQFLASASEDKTIRIWNVSSGECINTLPLPSRLRSVAFSPDGKTLASSGGDHIVRLWDVDNNYQCLMSLAHSKMLSVAFSPDSQTIVGGGEDFTIRIWNVRDGQCINTLPGHIGEVWSVAFSPDGQTIASGGEEGTIKLWNPETGKCKKKLTVLRPYEGINITDVTGLTYAQKISLKELGAVEDEE